MTTEAIFNGLNSAQKSAVEILSGPVLILAGAGSGKTKTLTHRIANLIAHGTDPRHILAVTFTNKAAREMRQRLWQLLNPDVDPHYEPPRSFMPFMGTFHGIAVRILREDGDAIDIPPNFVIYDTDDQKSLMKRIAKNLNIPLGKGHITAQSVYNIISSARDKGIMADEYAANATFADQKNIARIYQQYETEKRQANALDFDDLMFAELRLLEASPKIRQKWRQFFQQILIDEYQDTSTTQYQIIRHLVGPEQNICAVGDDWQSIYSWRGADFTNILNFEKDFPGTKVIKLERNYRSTGNILNAAQNVIRKNKTRSEKTLFTESGKGAPVIVKIARDSNEEALQVASLITLLQRQPDYANFNNFAILYRNNAQSLPLERTFVNMHIPYKVISGKKFYDRKEVKDMLAILRLLTSKRDKVSLERVAKNILPGIGEVSLTKILLAIDNSDAAAPLLSPTILDALNAVRAKNGIKKLADFIREIDMDLKPDQIIKRAQSFFELEKTYENKNPEEAEDRLQNLEVLAETASMYDSLGEFLADAALVSQADGEIGNNAVSLMTMHAAKGLEFPVVFLIGMSEGTFPSARALENGDIEEERRLAYVGMTRAMRQLILSYPQNRYIGRGPSGYPSYQHQWPSTFLREAGFQPENYPSGGYIDLDYNGKLDDSIPVNQPNSEFTDNNFNNNSIDPFPEDLPVFE